MEQSWFYTANVTFKSAKTRQTVKEKVPHYMALSSDQNTFKYTFWIYMQWLSRFSSMVHWTYVLKQTNIDWYSDCVRTAIMQQLPECFYKCQNNADLLQLQLSVYLAIIIITFYCVLLANKHFHKHRGYSGVIHINVRSLRAGCSKHRLELTARLTRGISPVNSWHVVPHQNPRVNSG